MTLAQCISYVDGIEPNAYTNEQKARWVSECEGRVWTDVFLQSPADFTPLTYSANSTDELSVKAPHDKIYDRYLRAMIHYANNEPDRYAMSYTLFNDAWGEFVRGSPGITTRRIMWTGPTRRRITRIPQDTLTLPGQRSR